MPFASRSHLRFERVGSIGSPRFGHEMREMPVITGHSWLLSGQYVRVGSRTGAQVPSPSLRRRPLFSAVRPESHSKDLDGLLPHSSH